MSFVTSLFGGGGGGGSSDSASSTLVDQIVGANQAEESRQKDITASLNDLVTQAASQSKSLGDAYDQRVSSINAGNRFITSGAGYAGVSGVSRSLGGDRWLLGG